MKSPHDILLERHRAAEPKLDAVRQMVLNNEGTKEQNWLAHLPGNIWQELVWPCRKVWAGMAVVWLAILVANVSMRSPASALAKKETPSKEMVIAFQQQRRLLEELIEAPDAAESPKAVLPQPRSERRDGWMAV